MQRREFVLALSLLPLSAVGIAHGGGSCPVCGGNLTVVGAIKDDTSRPSINLEVWNRSYHGYISEPFSSNSQFCKKCHFAYDEISMKWRRASEAPDSFFVPLLPVVRGFPITESRPKNLRVVYTQTFSGQDASQGRIESVGFWANDSELLRSKLENYASSNDLALHFYTALSMPGQVSVKAETPNNSFKPTPLRGAA